VVNDVTAYTQPSLNWLQSTTMSCRKTVLILIALSIHGQFTRQYCRFEAEVKCAIEQELD